MKTPASSALNQTTEVLLAAHELHSSEALDSRLWERRGFLKRLVRSG